MAPDDAVVVQTSASLKLADDAIGLGSEGVVDADRPASGAQSLLHPADQRAARSQAQRNVGVRDRVSGSRRRGLAACGCAAANSCASLRMNTNSDS